LPDDGPAGQIINCGYAPPVINQQQSIATTSANCPQITKFAWAITFTTYDVNKPAVFPKQEKPAAVTDDE
jgi:hypothetical protein